MLKKILAIAALFPSICANAAPISVFSMNPNPVDINQNVVFDGAASDAQDVTRFLVLWEWDLDGDGQFNEATGMQVVSSFFSYGDYDIGLRVTDNEGLSAASYQTLEVSAVPLPCRLPCG